MIHPAFEFRLEAVLLRKISRILHLVCYLDPVGVQMDDLSNNPVSSIRGRHPPDIGQIQDPCQSAIAVSDNWYTAAKRFQVGA